MMNKLILLLFPVCLFFACDNSDVDDMGNVKNPIDITQSDWKVIEIKNDTDVSNPAAVYSLKLNDDGTFEIRLDVNTCGGDYEINLVDKRIAFDPVLCTEACCDSENALDIAEVLARVTRYELAQTPGDVPLIFWAEPDYINFEQN